MVVSKTLKEYIYKTVHEKVVKKCQEKGKKEREIMDKISPMINEICEEARKKGANILEENGLDPYDYGFGEVYATTPGYANRPPVFYRRNSSVGYRYEQEIADEIILRIELGGIPKNEIMDYVNNYEIPDEK